MRSLVSILITAISAAAGAGIADYLCSDEINLHFGTWYGLMLAGFFIVRMATFADMVNDEWDN